MHQQLKSPIEVMTSIADAEFDDPIVVVHS